MRSTADRMARASRDNLTPAEQRELNARAGIMPVKPKKITLKPRDPMAAAILNALGLAGKERKGITFTRLDHNTITGLRSYWSSGHRDYYYIYDTETKTTAPVSLPGAYPFDRSPDANVTLTATTMLVRHTYSGTRKYVAVEVSPAGWHNVPWTPAATLTRPQTIVLGATSSLKASYGGRKPRVEACAKHGVDIEAEKPGLIALKYLRRNGSITPAGQQALEENREIHNIPRYF